MRPEACETELLRRLAAMPFLDRLEMAAVSGRSRGAVYEAVRKLEIGSLVASVPHAAQLIPSTHRYFLTATGLHRLARDEGTTVDELLARCPVSEQARRVLMERLDAAAVVYRLASALSNVVFPIRFRWYRAMPMDAAMTLPDGRIVAVVRQGLTADRTAFSKRLWRLREKFRPSAVLMLMPDEVRLRHARRLMAGAPSIAFLALERDAASAGANAPIWRPPSGPALLDLRTALSYARRRGAWPVEGQPSKVFLPGKITLEGPEHEVPGWMLPSLLKPAEKRAVDLLSDWPWIAPAHLGELLGVKRSMLSRILVRLQGLGLADDLHVEGGRRLALSDRGLALLARRDRSSVGAARKRWSVTPADPKIPLDWRNVSGRRSRQLLRNVEHTDAVHWFVAVLERQAHSRSREVVQLDPTRAVPHGTSGTATGCAPFSPTPSASSAGARGLGPSSWSGSAGPSGPRRWPHASPPTCATTPRTDRPTTTACSPQSSSCSRTGSRRPTSCEWRGRRWKERESMSPYEFPTGACWRGWGRWDAPGGQSTARNQATPSNLP